MKWGNYMIKLNVLFKKMQKDDKKEVLMFHVLSDELPHADELLKMPGSIALLNVEESEAGEVGAEFVSIQRDNKKTVLKFNIKRDVEGKVSKLYGFAGSNVSLALQPSQMTIDEFYEDDHEGIEYNVDSDGSVSVPEGQISIDEEESNHKLKVVK
jgi:transcription initiation factor IIF auxiliary subunit